MIIHGPHENIFYDVDVGPILLYVFQLLPHQD